MSLLNRVIDAQLAYHVSELRQMAFVSGPRQVGKTTAIRQVLSKNSSSSYFDWDNFSDRRKILDSVESFMQSLAQRRFAEDTHVCGFDELHKYAEWRDFLKGLFDNNPGLRILVTGSAQLLVFSRGGDSLRGRYFAYTLHPLSVAELAQGSERSRNTFGIAAPRELPKDQWEGLIRFGGFPEPFVKASQSFYGRWSHHSNDQLLREDIRDLTRVQELSQIEMLAHRIRHQAGQLTSFMSFARDIRSTVPTVRRWVEILESLHYCFRVSPWHTNVVGSLRKEPKYYLWDWSQVGNSAARLENLVASALLKFVNWRTEEGAGLHRLYFLRDKRKREVDFVVVRDEKPWFLVEVKTSDNAELSKSLKHFQEQTGATHAFQIAGNAEYVNRDCFEEHEPIILPAKTLLSQLV